MPRKKSGKKTAGARKVRKVAVSKVRKAAAKVTKRAKAVASNPKRTVRKAAKNVHATATRARQIGDSVVVAGELIRETAELVDSVAQRAGTRTGRSAAKKKKSR